MLLNNVLKAVLTLSYDLIASWYSYEFDNKRENVHGPMT